MSKSILSLFIDELGNFSMRDSHGPIYGFALVMHDQSSPIDENIDRFEYSLRNIGIPSDIVLHTAPLIRKKDQYEEMDGIERRKLFNTFFAFSRHLPISYKSFVFFKPDYETKQQLLTAMTKALSEFIRDNQAYFFDFDKIYSYYDQGQQEIALLLRTVFTSCFHEVEFKSSSPSTYRLQQVADMICTLEAIEEKRKRGLITKSEHNFFVSMKKFSHTYYRNIERLRFQPC